MTKDFVHLHLHTEYSLLDGSGKVKKVIEKVKELGMKSVAITDHGAMYGCVEFYKAAQEAGIKAIIGCEIYLAGKDHRIKSLEGGNDTYHLVLLVKNETGYNNLMKIVTEASLNGFYYKPRVDVEYLKAHSEGLVALSACLGGTVAKHLLRDEKEKAKQWAITLRDIFREDFYLEVQNHGMEEQIKVNSEVISLARELNIELVATNDVHYIEKEDYKAHDVLICIQTGKTVDDENRMKYKEGEFYIRSREEMEELFPDLEEALDNTVKIAEKCNFHYEFHHSKLPNFPLPEGTDHYEYLVQQCYKGLAERYDVITNEIKSRMDYELNIIKTMGYVDYFLIVWDFIKYAIDNNIMTGPGRGSAAGSIVAYSLGITKIDPIKYGLIFERFLNPERVSMPDVDSGATRW